MLPADVEQEHPTRELVSHVKYSSRWLVWDLRGRTLNVSEPTIFSKFHGFGKSKGHVEYASGLKLDVDSPGTLLVAFGVADCHAKIASFPVEVLHQLRYEFRLRGSDFLSQPLPPPDVSFDAVVGTRLKSVKFSSFVDRAHNLRDFK